MCVEGVLLLSAAHSSCPLKTCNDSGKNTLLLHAVSKMSHTQMRQTNFHFFIILQQSVLLTKEMYNLKTKKKSCYFMFMQAKKNYFASTLRFCSSDFLDNVSQLSGEDLDICHSGL